MADETVTIVIDLGAHYAEGDELSLADRILDRAAVRLLEKLESDKGLWPRLRDRVEAIRTEALDAAIRPAVEEAVATTLQPRNSLTGGPVGEPKTVEEMIVERAEKWLSESVMVDRGPFRGLRVSRVQQFIGEAVDATVRGQLAHALEAGKLEVQKALKEQGAELLSTAIARMAKVS
jgi:hypothetical protein